ncbi:Hypothetical protein D9617_11g010170 [Elsinoe fawcettii]|nr:Hypothetical protein D9617_11g010170 [Elsinoe fawcettii]
MSELQEPVQPCEHICTCTFETGITDADIARWRRSARPLTILITATPIITILSTICIIFKSISSASYDRHTSMSHANGIKSPLYGPSEFINLYPEHIIGQDRGLFFATAVVSLLFPLLIRRPLHVIRAHRSMGNVAAGTKRILLPFSSLILNFTTTSFVYATIMQAKSATFDAEYVPANTAYDKGAFTYEAWTCQLSTTLPATRAYGFQRQCLGEVAGRTMMGSIMSLMVIVHAIILYDLHSTKDFVQVEAHTKAQEKAAAKALEKQADVFD